MLSFGCDLLPAGLRPKVGIVGGSGLCSFPELQVHVKVRPESPYGLPSDEILVGECAGQAVAFVPRHGGAHTIAPHKVPYKANLASLKALGVEFVLGTCIVGSLKREIPPGSLVVPDQFINLTWGRDDYCDADGGSFIHLPMGEPYCAHMRQKAIDACLKVGAKVVQAGTVAVIQGPRFSTAAESRWLSANGWDIVNMTQYPECYFARELGLCYAAIAAVTDHDVGLKEDLVIDPHRMGPILNVFRENVRLTRMVLQAFLRDEAHGLACGCANLSLKAYYEEGE